MINYKYKSEYKYLDDFYAKLNHRTFLSYYIDRYYYYVKKNLTYLSADSITHMFSNIGIFEKFLYYQYPDINSIKELNESHIEAFKIFCITALGNQKKSANIKLMSLKSFFKYLVCTHEMSYNLVLNVPTLKVFEEKTPPIFDISDLKCLFNTMRKYIYGERDILISKIILTTGVQIKHILNLTVHDIDIKNNRLFLNNNVYPIKEGLSYSIRSYLSLRATLNIYGNDILFLSRRGHKYSIRTYQHFFKSMLLDISTLKDKKLSPKNLRYTYIYNLVKIEDDEEVVKILTNQDKVEHYFEKVGKPLKKKCLEDFENNPLQNII